MKTVITEKQLEMLSYLNVIFNIRGEMPTFAEMMKHFGLNSKASVDGRLQGLIRKGYLQKVKRVGKLNNYEITKKGKMDDKVFRLCPMCGHLTDKVGSCYYPFIKERA